MFGGRDGGDVASLVAACVARGGEGDGAGGREPGGASLPRGSNAFIEVAAPTVPPHHVSNAAPREKCDSQTPFAL